MERSSLTSRSSEGLVLQLKQVRYLTRLTFERKAALVKIARLRLIVELSIDLWSFSSCCYRVKSERSYQLCKTESL